MEKALLYCPNSEEAAILMFILQQAGYTSHQLRDIEQKLDETMLIQYQLALLVMTQPAAAINDPLLSLVKRLNNIIKLPMIVICAQLSEDLHVALLESGVEVVFSKPYSTRVLHAQLRNIRRRFAGLPTFATPIISHGGMTLEPARRVAYVKGHKPQRLTQLEFRLLFMLMSHIGQIIPVEDIVEQVWGYNESGGRNLVRGVIQRLRSKLEPDPHNPCYILTESGVGYYFKRFDEPEN